MNLDYIKSFLSRHNYDVRKSGDARWIDQKCTYDVLSVVSDCILEYIENTNNKEFTVKDIWLSEYARENVISLFSKPDPKLKASNEYDKYFGQPIKLLSYSKILKYRKSGNKFFYMVDELELLKYIALRPSNSLEFLISYINKVLSDSDIIENFISFYQNQDNASYKDLKDRFCNFTIQYTNINKMTECGRIFTKIINPLAFKMKKKGTEKGRLSKDIITLLDISYNRENWRDELSGKSKTETRSDFERKDFIIKNNWDKYNANKSKKFLKYFNDREYNGKSEVNQKTEMVLATQAHHIFPRMEYPEIATFLENLIMLTPNQHFSMAHPKNNTQYIDKNFQYICLIAKIGKIMENLTQDKIEKIYSFDNCKHVLNIGIKTTEFSNIRENDFYSILEKIDFFYSDFSVYEDLKTANYPVA
ncbi:TPA: hypothetical protein ACUM1O_000657 [Haemophilus influenzae]|uniref:restriction endonuclease n=2 Tax=Haemophilus influenzae TaxID=727 RepID=UPI000DD4AFA9|nr:restriction endonuclease [Haemophilus influenzae]MBZ5691114.1 hypothetical protein [Haemophilus influenzae]MCK8914056.1 hypothetical protein [Haemophilus influenzae]MCK8922852.1 hypothetical protein [Haemophilus influenzae]MCK9642653.1 hypothetical protein [Haemophilus influenzae]